MGLVRPERRNPRRIDGELRREVIRLAAKGATYREILDEVDTSMGAITIVFKQWGGVTRWDQRWEPSPHRLSLDDRIEIKLGLERGESYQRIADRIGRNRSTVCREVNNNRGRSAYKPGEGHQRAWEQTRRPKPTRLEENQKLCRRVIADLTKLWSPEQIAERLKDEFPDDETMHVSHETIYKSIYVQGRGSLRRELAACLRTGRAQRRPRGRQRRQGRIPGMIMISERPAEVEDRAVPGHWEGDLIIGKNNKSAIGTLVERTTRYVMLLHLPDGFGAEAVRDAMTASIKTLPDHLLKSITWDQGREMVQHTQFSVDSGIDIYFCDPHSPWQRGSNENTNGLLRQWFPKGTDLSVHGPDKLLEVAQLLNDRPRKTLGWKKPAEVLAQLITGDDVATTG
jgi:transposase, IS30 family